MSLVAAALALGACASIGPNYDPALVETLKPGMTKAQVMALLGKPTTTSRVADGTQQLMWVHSRGTMFGTAQARSVTLGFDAADRYLGTVSQAETNIR